MDIAHPYHYHAHISLINAMRRRQKIPVPRDRHRSTQRTLRFILPAHFKLHLMLRQRPRNAAYLRMLQQQPCPAHRLPNRPTPLGLCTLQFHQTRRPPLAQHPLTPRHRRSVHPATAQQRHHRHPGCRRPHSPAPVTTLHQQHRIHPPHLPGNPAPEQAQSSTFPP